MNIEEHRIEIFGLHTRYLTAGSGPVVILLHATGESAADWQWIIPVLARTHRVYAPDLFSYGETIPSDTDCSAEFFTRFIATFLDTLGIASAAIVGNSFGGLNALLLALSEPSRVSALGLIDSAGLGREMNLGLMLLATPVLGDIASASSKTLPGSRLRAWFRASLLFANYGRVPREWYMEQYRLARLPYFVDIMLSSVRANINIRGQRIVVLDQLPHLRIPALIIWGGNDLVVPLAHAQNAVRLLQNGRLEVIENCGHLPHVERPVECAAAISTFLSGEPQRVKWQWSATS